MKNRKLILGVFLILAVLFLGIGYAALSNSLSMTGTINSTADDDNLVVQFDTGYAPYSEVSGNHISISASKKSDKEISISVGGFSTENDTAVIYFKIINNSNEIESYDALLSNFTVAMKHGATLDTASPATGTASENKFVGEHFTVEVEYVESYQDKEAGQAVNSSATITDGVPTLKAQGHEYVYVKVTVKVNPTGITENLEPHYFTVNFSAETKN